MIPIHQIQPTINEILTDSTVATIGDTLTLTSKNEFNYYIWSTKEKTKSIKVTETGTYSLKSYNSNCDSTIFAQIYVSFKPIISSGNSKNLYPNPAENKITLKYYQSNSEITRFILCDIMGRKMNTLHEVYLNSGIRYVDLDLSLYSSGMYYIQAVNQHQSLTFRLVLNK